MHTSFATGNGSTTTAPKTPPIGNTSTQTNIRFILSSPNSFKHTISEFQKTLLFYPNLKEPIQNLGLFFD